MNRWITRCAAVLVAGSVAFGGATGPATAARDDGSNWAHPTALGLSDCTFKGPFIDTPLNGVFSGEEVPRRRWVCSSFDITFAVYRYATTAQAQAAQESTIGEWHTDYAQFRCQPDAPGGCGSIRSLGGGRVFAASDAVNYGVKVVIDHWTSGSASVWGWMQGAWARTGTYVVVAEQTSFHYASGYFRADELVAAAKNLANNPPSGIAVGSFTDPTNSGSGPPASTGAKKKANLAKATAAARGTRAFAKQRGKRYNRLTTPSIKQLRANGTRLAAARTARFSGFRPRPASRVWINLGGVCLRANGKKNGTWKQAPCPNVAWTIARR